HWTGDSDRRRFAWHSDDQEGRREVCGGRTRRGLQARQEGRPPSHRAIENSSYSGTGNAAGLVRLMTGLVRRIRTLHRDNRLGVLDYTRASAVRARSVVALAGDQSRRTKRLLTIPAFVDSRQ